MEPKPNAVAKKEKELFYLKEFISDPAHGLRISKIEASETPDFILHTLDGKISVELTQLIDPSLKQHEMVQSKIVNLAKELFLAKNPKVNLDVHVTFSNQFRRKQWNPENIAQELFEEIDKLYQFNKNFNFRISTPVGTKFKALSYVDRLYVGNERLFQEWQPFGAFLVDYIDPKWITNAVKKKETGLSKYGHQYDQNWLLMVSNIGHKSSSFRFEKLGESKIEGGFDRMFIYQYRDDKWFEL